MSRSIFDGYELLIFDLDGTLYDDKQYYNEVNHQIAEYIYSKHNVAPRKTISFLQSGLTYSDMDNFYGFNELDKCLEIRRSCIMPNPMLLYPWIEELLLQLKGKHNFTILTNGNKQQQQNKVNQIAWPFMFDVFYANPQKPDPTSVFDIQKKYGILNCLMIGNEETDRQCAKNAKIDFIFVNDL